MPQTIAEPVAHLASAVDATSYSLGAFTPAANAVLLVFAFAENNIDASGWAVTGGGLTWTKKASILFNSVDTGYLFWAYTGAAPASCTITFSDGTPVATACMIAPFQITGVNVTDPDPIRQVKTNSALNTANPNATLDSAMLTGNCYVAAYGCNSNPPTTTPPSGWTETMDEGVGGGSQQPFACSAAYRVNGETGSTVTFTAAIASWGMIVAELNGGTSVRITELRCRMIREVRQNEAVAAQRRVYFDIRQTDGTTAAAAETSGQPMISINAGAWTSSGIGALAAIIPSSKGRYYADLSVATVSGASIGDIIESTFKSANTIECAGDTIVISPRLSIKSFVSDSIPSVSSIRGSILSGLSRNDNDYRGMVMVQTAGVNAGETRKVSAYVGSSLDFQFTGASGDPDAPWDVAAPSGSPFELLGKIR